MKKVILHLGAPKTGTTAIQKFLHINHDKLASNESILYPTAGRINKEGKIEISHGTHLVRAIKNGNNPRPILLDVERQAHGFNQIILSSEAFFGQLHNPRVQLGLKRINEFYKDDELKIILYIRRWDLYLESVYNQATKHGVLAIKGNGDSIHDFISYCEKVIGWHPADYLKYISILENIFGMSSIEVRSFDSKTLIGGDLIQDFCEASNIKNVTSYKIPEKSNESLNTKQILVVSLLIPIISGTKKPLIQKVVHLFKEDSLAFSHHCFFNQEERISLINRFQKDQDKLCSYMRNPTGFLFDLESIADKSSLPPVQFSFEELKEFRDLILDYKNLELK